MASKNKSIGRKAESKIVDWFADRFGLTKLVVDRLGANLGSAEVARAEEVSQLLDNEGVDIWFSPSTEFSELNVQVKNKLVTGKTTKSIDIQPLLDMPDRGMNILITDVKYRPGKRNMMPLTTVVTMDLETFGNLMSVYVNYMIDEDKHELE